MRFFYKIGNVFLEGNSLSDLFKYCLGQIVAYLIVIGLIVFGLYWLASWQKNWEKFFLQMIGASLHCGAQSLFEKSNLTSTDYIADEDALYINDTPWQVIVDS